VTPSRPDEAVLPLAALCALLLATTAAFAVRCALAGRPRTAYIESRATNGAWKWLMEWWIWLWGPLERACTRLGVPPNAITVASAALTAAAGALLGLGHLSLGGWVYLAAASLDIVDGRVARARGRATPAGAFLDSTLDRVAELLVFSGLAVYLRATPWLYAALAGASASIIVSYARARGEALGALAAARTGGMQRAERIALTAVPCALAPLADAALGEGGGTWVLGTSLSLLALLTTATAARRTRAVFAALGRPAPEARPRSPAGSAPRDAVSLTRGTIRPRPGRRDDRLPLAGARGKGDRLWEGSRERSTRPPRGAEGAAPSGRGRHRRCRRPGPR
jgi:CDP-diacylglycerol--glycerol-3-phosphate 3-phosphatidyltransferase